MLQKMENNLKKLLEKDVSYSYYLSNTSHFGNINSIFNLQRTPD